MMSHKHFMMHWYMIGILFMLAVFSEYSGFDLFWAGQFYDSTQQIWPYKNAFLTSTLLHTNGKHLVTFLLLANIATLFLSFFNMRLAIYRKVLAYLLLASISGPTLVGLLKSNTHIYTPWTLAVFDGSRPYVRMFDSAPAGLPYGHAFPGGHSSGGFAFMAVFYCAIVLNYSYRHIALVFPLLLGGSFALAQEVRGAHFISHDLISLVICWSCALLWFRLFFGSRKPDQIPATIK